MTALKIAFLWWEEGGDAEWGTSVSCPTPGTPLESQECVPLRSPTLLAAKAVWFDPLWHRVGAFTSTQVLGRIFLHLGRRDWRQKNRGLKFMLHSGASSALKTGPCCSGNLQRRPLSRIVTALGLESVSLRWRCSIITGPQATCFVTLGLRRLIWEMEVVVMTSRP